MHPDDYVPTFERPWTNDELSKATERAHAYHQAMINNKFFNFRRPKINKIPDEEWTFFPGDLVQ
ncbi:hypothetical protein OESDEN_18381, partial [Oesophagostomum dentatum]